MFLRGDIVVIIGLPDTGKTTFAKHLASTLDNNFIYLDFIHTTYADLDKIYDENKHTRKIIIFDNYIELISNARRMNLFTQNNKFTLIFVINHISKNIIERSDIVYFAKNTTDYIINSYYNSIQKYYKNKNKFVSSIKRIVDYGFVCLDKDNRYQNDEEIITVDNNKL